MNKDQSNSRSASMIRTTLMKIGAIKSERISLFSNGTRDNPSISVYRDTVSGVIFIDDFYVGDEEYLTGQYRAEPQPLATLYKPNYEDITDSERRYEAYRQLTAGKYICDFGCGAGSYLKLARHSSNEVCGIELQENYVADLNKQEIKCYSSIENVNGDLDVISMFHCLEHLPDPLTVLEQCFSKLKKNSKGSIIIEVPHARDFLIEHLTLQEFVDFTLWSQHLVLHTRESLRLLLAEAGFNNIIIQGIQRYSVSNHLHWLAKKQPGGHKSILSALQTKELTAAYANALAHIDATDTLVAIATT